MDPFNSKFILSEQRMQWIDYDKGISIILVGFGHCLFTLQSHMIDLSAYPVLTYLATFLYGFRMPLFFIVSGLLVGRSLQSKGLNRYIGDRANNILYPLLIWGIIEITMQIVSAKLSPFSANGHVSPTKYVQLLTDPRETGHFWYLNALFCIGVIYAFVRQVLKLGHIAQLSVGLALFCVSSNIHLHDLKAGLFTDVFQFYIFFAIGDFLSDVLLNEQVRQRLSRWVVFIPLGIAFLVMQYFFAQINLRPSAEGINFVEHKMPFFYLIEALVGCAFSMSVSFMLQKYGKATWLRVIGYHSLFIYCMQMIVMDLTRIAFNRVLHISYPPALVLAVWAGGIILPIFIYNFCLKYRLWWLYTYKRPKRQVEYLRTANIFSPVRSSPAKVSGEI
ncbi:MAG: acyltransferase [Bacteroidota bacterium]